MANNFDQILKEIMDEEIENYSDDELDMEINCELSDEENNIENNLEPKDIIYESGKIFSFVNGKIVENIQEEEIKEIEEIKNNLKENKKYYTAGELENLKIKNKDNGAKILKINTKSKKKAIRTCKNFDD